MHESSPFLPPFSLLPTGPLVIPDSLVSFPLGYLPMVRRHRRRHRCNYKPRPRYTRPRLAWNEEQRHGGLGSVDLRVFDWLDRNESWAVGWRVRFLDPELDQVALLRVDE